MLTGLKQRSWWHRRVLRHLQWEVGRGDNYVKVDCACGAKWFIVH